LAPIVNGEKVKAPYNQQQFGGTAGGPIVHDKVFFFGSYERRRERSQVVVTAAEANGEVVPTPADEHQGHAKLDWRFSNKNSLGVRYNMVAGRRTTRAAASTCRAPASTGTTTSTRCTAHSPRSSPIRC
jgi:hypothetical protein